MHNIRNSSHLKTLSNELLEFRFDPKIPFHNSNL